MLTGLRETLLLRHRMATGIAVVTVLVILIAIIFYRQSAAIDLTRDTVLHTQQVISHIELLHGKIKDAEVSERGYIITGNEDYLRTYHELIHNSPEGVSDEQHLSIPEEISFLEKLTQDNPVQQRNIYELNSVTSELLKYFVTTIALRKDKGEAAIKMIDLNNGAELMDKISALVSDMTKEENNLLSARVQINKESTEQKNLLVFYGIILFYLGMLLAVSMITRLDQGLANSRAYLKNIINHVADPIFVKDVNHRWIDGNAALWNLFGKPESELLGKSDYDFFPKEQADVFWQKDAEVFASDEINTNVEYFTDAAGVTHKISTKKASFKGPDGTPILVGVIRDITELSLIQEKLKESDEARLRSIMDHCGRPVYIKDLEGRYLQVNKEMAKIFECEEKDFIGKTVGSFLSREYAYESRRSDQLVVKNATAMEFEDLVELKDGLHTFILVKFPLYDASGKIYAICGIETDITERKKVEAQLIRYTNELERSNQELDDFAYIASHDLKEPLRGIFNHASFLIEDYKDKLDKDGLQRLGRMTYLSKHLEKLINDLLYFSRLGRVELAVQKTDIGEVVKEIGEVMEFFLQAHNAYIIVPLPLPVITCDKPRVTEVFRNLITNAVKYNDKKERLVEVGFLDNVQSPQGLERNVFYVKDNGIGIEKEFYKEIFRIFRRLGADEENTDGGTGSGLTFVKKIIERHKGKIWPESELGKGTIFYFTLG